MKPTKPPSHIAHGHHHPPEEMHNEGVAHERSDIDIRAIVMSMVFMFAICGTVAVLMAGLLKLLEYRFDPERPCHFGERPARRGCWLLTSCRASGSACESLALRHSSIVS